MKITDDSLYCPPLPLLWAHHPGDGSSAAAIHKAYLRELWRERGTKDRLKLVARFLAWPVIVLGATGYFTYFNGFAIKRRMGKGVARQVLDQISLAARHGVLPPWYYMFELYHPANYDRAAEYLNRFETKYNIYELLKRTVERTAPKRTNGHNLNNKALFASICAQKGVPTAPVVGIARDGHIRALDDWAGTGAPHKEPALPDRDLFVKPMQGKGGRGTLRARYAGDSKYELSDDRTLSREDLAQHLKDLSAERPFIIQHCLVNHPDLSDLCAGALSCVRTVTCRNAEGGFEVTNAAFRMAMRNDTTVDGLHRGGMVSKVDLETGALSKATDLGFKPNIGWRETNPYTGVQIEGRVLPLWDDLKALAEQAHAAFPYKVTVGWDIAITADGPIIVEGNGSPCVDIIQRVDQPMGSARFGELLAYHVEQALEAQKPLAAEPVTA